ncbi:MAG: phage tail protein [Saprospiraceae bacterium]|nr:phage tail protein [Saprospiraceae bacterium]
MKSKFFLLLFFGSLFAPRLFAQNAAPQGFSYQAIVRDASGAVLANQPVMFYFDLREGTPQGSTVYSESQEATTNEFGLVNLYVGQGKPVGTTRFSGVDWAASSKFLTISLDPGTGLITNLGTSQLMSVPYALFAAKAGESNGDNDPSDDVTVTTPAGGQISGTFDNLQLAQQGAYVGQVMKWDGTKWAPGEDEKGKNIASPEFNPPGQVPVGTILPWASNLTTPPAGYLFCNGNIVTSTQYPDLWSVIGTTWGTGNSTSNTDFHLPDLRGRFMRGVSGTTSNDPNKSTRTYCNVGGLAGNNVGSLQDDELKSHKHAQRYTTATNRAPGAGDWHTVAGEATQGANTSATGGLETRPKNVNVNYIIKW